MSVGTLVGVKVGGADISMCGFVGRDGFDVVSLVGISMGAFVGVDMIQ